MSNQKFSGCINWVEINKDWEASGLPQKVFCEQRGVSYGSFIHHRSRLSAEEKNQVPSTQGALVPIAKLSPSPGKNLTYDIEFPSGIKLSVSDHFELSSLEQLLHLLEIRRC